MIKLLIIILILLKLSDLHPLSSRLVFDGQLKRNHFKRTPSSINDDEISQLIATNILQMSHQISINTPIISTTKYHIFSPISIASILSLLLIGSKSTTHNELSNLLGFNMNSIYLKNSKKFHQHFGLLIEQFSNDKLKKQYKKNKFIFNKNNLNNENLEILPRGELNDNNSDSNNNNNQYSIDIANGIFIQNGYKLKSNYKLIVEKIYHSDILNNMDFNNNPELSRQYINDWAKYKTNGKIKNIIDDGIESNTKMIIASALYFKGYWLKEFINSSTIKNKFYPNGKNNLIANNDNQEYGSFVYVDMMANGGEYSIYDSKEYDCRILGLPFKENLSTMYVILPNKSNKKKLLDLQKILTANKIEEIIGKMEKKMILVNIPKMHLENTINLKEIFTQMGIKSLFNSEESYLTEIISNKKSILNLIPSSELKNINHFDQKSSFIFRGSTTKVKKINLKSLIASTTTIATTRQMNQQNFHEENQAIIKNGNSNYDKIIENREKRTINIIKSNQNKNLNNIQTNLNHDDDDDDDIIERNSKVFVDNIIHKVDLILNESGTEAAATTISQMTRIDFEDEFIVDSPFIFLIRHETTKLPIFYGTVFQP